MGSKTLYPRFKSPHQQRVELMMLGADQELPDRPKVPSEAVRLLRARLMTEESLETIEAMGVSIFFHGQRISFKDLEFKVEGPFNMIEVVDGCGDTIVVTTGTLSAMGVADIAVQEAIDRNNLDKFKEGHYIDQHGKLNKPPGHVPVTAELEKILQQQQLGQYTVDRRS